MEHPPFSNCIPVVFGNGQTAAATYYACDAAFTSSSDNSMDAADHHMKIKEARAADNHHHHHHHTTHHDDEFFSSWSSDVCQVVVAAAANNNDSGDVVKEEEDDINEERVRCCKVSRPFRNHQQERLQLRQTDKSPDAVKGEMDIYLDKSHLNAARSGQTMMGESVTAQSLMLPRKRKLDQLAGWPGGKARTGIHQRDMIGSRGWPVVDELDIDLSNELSNPGYSMSEALLNLPVFKQEASSPTHRDPTSPTRAGAPWLNSRQQMIINGNNTNNNNLMNNGGGNCISNDQHSPSSVNHVNSNPIGANANANQQVVPNNANPQTNGPMGTHTGNAMSTAQTMPAINAVTTYTSGGLQETMNSNNNNNNNNGIMLCSPHAATAMDSFNSCAIKPMLQQQQQQTQQQQQQQQQPTDNIFAQDNRFQYVLAAATSIATKCNEETLTYLNQCQSYEIKLKKLGDLSHYRGKILKSVIRICFHERRLQYAEREQMSLWQSERPGERIVEVDAPLSYGLLHISQPTDQLLLNTVDLYWDPVKEAGVYIKVNCISTEFTAKKHGGEKGVPFRIQIETFLPGDGLPGSVPRAPNQPLIQDKRLHAACCQIKVFKLKGADRKHKQDREKILRRPQGEREKFQPSYDCTIFADLSSEAVFSPVPVINQPYSPENCNGGPARPSASSSVSPPRLTETAAHTGVGEMKYPQRLSRTDSHGSSLDCDDDAMGRQVMQCMPLSPSDKEVDILTESSTPNETRAWLSNHRFVGNAQTFGNFSGSDLLRLSRDDLIQICGLADGIRLFNALHAERAPARITFYVKKVSELQFNAIYLRSCQVNELKRKLNPLLQDGNFTMPCDVFVSGPNGIKIRLTDEVVQNLKNDSMFRLEPVEGGVILNPANQ